MLTELREKSQSFGIYILFGILIFVFIFFFGPQSEGCQPGGTTMNLSDWAAEVGGEEIVQREVEISVRRQALYDPDFDSDAEALALLRRQAAQQIVEQAVVEQHARRMGLAVSDEALSQYIISDDNPDFPLFSDAAGNFDAERYRAQLTQSLGATADVYRRAKRREMIVQRYLMFLGSQVQVSEAEARAAFDRSRRTWNLEFLAIDPEEHVGGLTDPTPAEGKAYAAKNADEVQGYYDDNKSSYDRDKEVKVRRVLIRKPKEGGAEAETAAKAKAEELRVAAMAEGADFEAIARESSEGYYKSFGGDMGWQSKANTAEQDYTVYAALEKGAVSEVQTSPIGFWFVKAEDVKPAVKKSLDEVRDEIGLILARKNQRIAAARELAKETLDKVKRGASLDDARPLPPAPPVEGAEEGFDDPTVEVPGPDEEAIAEEPTPTPDEDAAAAAVKGPEVESTGPFSADRPQWDMIPGIGKSEALAGMLDGLTAEKPLVDEAIEVGGKVYVVRLKERVEPDDEAFAKEKDTFMRRLRDQRAARLLGNWQAVLFGPVRQREVLRRFTGGALQTLVAKAEYRLNPDLYPAPQMPADPQPKGPAVPTPVTPAPAN